MLCFFRFFASEIWRNTSNCSTECDNKRLTNELMLRGPRLGKSGMVILLSILFLLYSFVPTPLFAQLIFGDGFEDEIVGSVPDAPTLDLATPGDENVKLSFTSNSDGGLEITGYIATCGGFSQPGMSSPITISGLTNGVTYVCSVTASNEAGQSEKSNEESVTPIRASIEYFDVTTDRNTALSCGDTNIEFSWAANKVDSCYGTWAESEANPEGLLDGNVNQATGTLSGSETVLFEDLASTKSFTLACKTESGVIVAEQSEVVEVKAPCLSTRMESWKDMFTREWHGPVNSRPYVRISGDKSLAIQFNTGPILTSEPSNSSPLVVTGMQRGARYSCSVVASNSSGQSSAPSNLVFFNPVENPDEPILVTATTAPVPSAPTLVSAELGHLSAELAFTDEDSSASSYTASCRISTYGLLGTIEFGGTRGSRLLAVSENPGDFDVAEECRQYQYLSDWLVWKTEGSDREGMACDLKSDTDYYWNLTFTDGVNAGTSSCSGTPCQTYIRIANLEYVN